MSLDQVLQSALNRTVEAATENPYGALALGAVAAAAIAVTTVYSCCFSTNSPNSAKDRARKAFIDGNTSRLGDENAAKKAADNAAKIAAMFRKKN